MTRKQDLIVEAKSLGIEINSKDTIPILCKKIQKEGVQSKNCPSPKKRGRPAKITSPKITSPKITSPKITSPKIALKKSPAVSKVNKKSPKVTKTNKILKEGGTSQSPKYSKYIKKGTKKVSNPNILLEKNSIPSNELQFTCPELEKKITFKLESDDIINRDDLDDILIYIKQLQDIGYYIKKSGEIIYYNTDDLRGNKYTFEENRNDFSKYEVDDDGIRQYNRKKKLVFIGMTDTYTMGSGVPSGIKRERKLNLFFTSGKQYYELILDVKMPTGMNTPKQRVPLVFSSSFYEVEQNEVDVSLTYADLDFFEDKLYINDTGNKITFNRFEPERNRMTSGNLEFNFQTDDVSKFFILPEWIK